jgi:hypothetical protein
MKVIEYRVQYTGAKRIPGGGFRTFGQEGASYEVVCVNARDINSGFSKALKLAREPLGNGDMREIGAIEFWQVKA